MSDIAYQTNLLALNSAIEAALSDVSAQQAAAAEELTASSAQLADRAEVLAHAVSFFRGEAPRVDAGACGAGSLPVARDRDRVIRSLPQ